MFIYYAIEMLLTHSQYVFEQIPMKDMKQIGMNYIFVFRYLPSNPTKRTVNISDFFFHMIPCNRLMK